MREKNTTWNQGERKAQVPIGAMHHVMVRLVDSTTNTNQKKSGKTCVAAFKNMCIHTHNECYVESVPYMDMGVPTRQRHLGF